MALWLMRPEQVIAFRGDKETERNKAAVDFINWRILGDFGTSALFDIVDGHVSFEMAYHVPTGTSAVHVQRNLERMLRDAEDSYAIVVRVEKDARERDCVRVRLDALAGAPM
jgi:hypothetical protein